MQKNILRLQDIDETQKKIKDIYKELLVNITKVTNILEDRNYTLDIQEDSKWNIDIVLKINWKTISLREKYLPKWYRFISWDTFTTRSSLFSDIENKLNLNDRKEKDYTVTFDKKVINKKYFLLRLLHELWHANDLESNKKLRNALREKDIALLQWFFKKYFLSIIYKTSKFIKRNDLLPNWYLEKLANIRSEIERKAWSWALKEARKLEKIGINILDNWYKEFVQNSLFTYKLSYINDRLLYGLDIREEDMALFVKKDLKRLLIKI